MGQMWMRVSTDLLRDMFHLPEDTKITNARYVEGRYVDILVGHEDIPDRQEIPIGGATFTADYDENGKPTSVNFESWDMRG